MEAPISKDSFNTKSTLTSGTRSYFYYSLKLLEQKGFKNVSRLPYSLKILLESLLRNQDEFKVYKADIEALANWDTAKSPDKEIAFSPARVILQDFTGVPCVVDLATMRDAMKQAGKDPKKINPLVGVDLVIDHSVQVDAFGSADALAQNTKLEFERNVERYQLLRWAQNTFQNFRVVPPGTGIVHQVNLEYLAPVVCEREIGKETFAFPDTVVGTDSHTTMINGLGVLGWGVGGIEAEAAMLGQPISMNIPQVVGFKLTGALREGVTATDLVLTVTQILRAKGVVGKFVEFFGAGLEFLSLPDRATLANMAPEYGATMGIFPVDQETLAYLRLSGRKEELVQLVETYYKAQGLFRDKNSPDPLFSEIMELDLDSVEPSLAGPKRPQDRVALKEVKKQFQSALPGFRKMVSADGAAAGAAVAVAAEPGTALQDGSVVIAAITSCTNTSNPSVMVGAGLVAKKAVEKGLQVKPWVKTSLAPGSKVVADYLNAAGLLAYLEKLNFHIVGYGCTTCIGNSGPLPAKVESEIKEKDLVVSAVLSGNRNFEGRVHALVKANYLASPPLVVAYALAGSVEIDLSSEPVGHDQQGSPVYLRDIWPTNAEVRQAMSAIGSETYRRQYESVFEGDENWRAIKVPAGDNFVWDEKSSYVRRPPFLENQKDYVADKDIIKARVLVKLGDSVTTDHISPAGSIAEKSPAGQYLLERGIAKKDFNSYGARRGNHEVMMRGTFANIRIKNHLVPGREGWFTRYLPHGEEMSIYDAAARYQKEKTPLVILAGKEYGSGSSRDWAAKGTLLLGIKAVIAESFERIHRSNLIGMGVLPLEFLSGQNQSSLGLSGEEEYTVTGISGGLTTRKLLRVTAKAESGEKNFEVLARIDTPEELLYLKAGGILPYVLNNLMK